MTHLFRFKSDQFKPADEQPNPINPIAGEGVLLWLAAALRSEQVTADEPAPEDWGWYTGVRAGPRVYMLGASGEWAPEGERTEWVLQLDLHRTLMEKLRGANVMSEADELSARIASLLRQDPRITDLEIELTP